MKKFLNPPNIHQPVGGYTHQIEVRGPERLLVLSGQVGMREDGTVPEDPIEQYDAALENLERNLHAADMRMEDVIKVTFYLVGEWDAARRREALAARMKGHQPCMTLIFVAGLAAPIYKVEIDAWASKQEAVGC